MQKIVLRIENLANRLAKDILKKMKSKSGSIPITIDNNGNLQGYSADVFSHKGIYGFCINKDKKSAVIYIGKAENGMRLQQHLTGKNKNGEPIAGSVSHKNNNIKQAIKDDFSVYLCLYANNEFYKSSLSCIEIATSLLAKEDMTKIFPNENHWNKRIG